MSDPFERVKAGRLTFKGGSLAVRSKNIDKIKKKKKKKDLDFQEASEDISDATVIQNGDDAAAEGGEGGGAEVVYTIDAAKKMKYEEIFPVETKKFGYDPKTKLKSVEDALDDRVKKKADRYCK